MQLHSIVALLSLVAPSVVNTAAVPGTEVANVEHAQFFERDAQDTHAHELYKRKGGGGGGGKGGGSSGGSSGSSGGSGSRGGGSSGSSFGGSGAPRSFGGGKFYGGGAASPYKAGGRSPSGILPVLLIGTAALAFWPGVWLYGAYSYPFTNPYHFHNVTTDQDQDIKVICGCDPYSPCACDENSDSQYLNSLVGSGAYDQLNKSLVTVAQVNDTTTLLINGTLPNGTQAPSDNGVAPMGVKGLVGYWPMVVAVLAAVFIA